MRCTIWSVLDEQIERRIWPRCPPKVDMSVRHVWKRIEVLIQEAADEVKLQSKRGQHLKADLERLKDYCQRCMELIEWKQGKPRKLDGRSGYLLLKGNGGRPAVEVYDESLVPDELCTVTVTMTQTQWPMRLQRNCRQSFRSTWRQKSDHRQTPSPSLLISARHSRSACQGCEVRRTAAIRCSRPTEDRYISMQVDMTCSECGGSGKASVPGARLKEPATANMWSANEQATEINR